MSFKDVQCSESAVWALTASGTVVVWQGLTQLLASGGTVAEPPCRGAHILGGLDLPVRAMSVGPTHASFLQEDGELYCIGNNRCGQCGVHPSKHGEVVSKCRRQEFPRHITPIAMTHCGRSHTVAIGAEGQVLAWGDDSKIQLGLGDTRSNLEDDRPRTGSRGFLNKLRTGQEMAVSPTMRYGPGGSPNDPSYPSFSRAPSRTPGKYGEFEAHYQWKPALAMEIPLEFQRQAHGIPYPPPDGLLCGDDFTVLIVRDSPDWYPPEEETNRLFCCGENGKGQCGRALQRSQQTFAAVRLPRCSRTISASCGSAHCLALLSRTRSPRKLELWMWGTNEKGQAGSGKLGGTVCPAARLRLPRDARIELAWCGFSSSAAICSERLRRSRSSVDSRDEESLDDAETSEEIKASPARRNI